MGGRTGGSSGSAFEWASLWGRDEEVDITADRCCEFVERFLQSNMTWASSMVH